MIPTVLLLLLVSSVYTGADCGSEKLHKKYKPEVQKK